MLQEDADHWVSEEGAHQGSAMVQEGVLPGMIKGRYSTYSTGVGKKIRDGKVACPAHHSY